ncbi:MAG: ankyrin repeat domain-containing protein [Puniceicoccales bacterium]|jgi:hypothetical protein|nr:ankyrin repeat domain-containing protein [Puniceicoccales bacterium]
MMGKINILFVSAFLGGGVTMNAAVPREFAFLIENGMVLMNALTFHFLPRLAHMSPSSIGHTSLTEDEMALVNALSVGDLETVRFYLDAGIDPNLIVNFTRGMTLLMYAIFERLRIPGLVQTLAADARFDPNIHNSFGDTAAHMCVKTGDIRTLNDLLDLPNFDLNARGQGGQTIMHIIIQRWVHLPDFDLWEETVGKIFANERWDHKATNDEGKTVKDLLLAINAKDNAPLQENINTLTQKISELEAKIPELIPEMELRDIIMGGDEDEVQNWIAANSNIDVNWLDFRNGNRTLLMYAVSTGNVAIVQAILALGGVNTNLRDSEGKIALDYARAGHDKRMIELIREKED